MKSEQEVRAAYDKVLWLVMHQKRRDLDGATTLGVMVALAWAINLEAPDKTENPVDELLRTVDSLRGERN